MRFVLALLALLTLTSPAGAQTQYPDGSPTQREAMDRLGWMDGEWRGTAEVMVGPGQTKSLPHTERIGTTLGGSIRVIEGHTYNPDGATAFNAFAVLSWDDAEARYVMRSYANGQAADLPMEADEAGFRWTMPSRGGEVRYVTTFADGEWVETGDFVMPGRDPMRVITLRLHRVGDTGWPSEGAVPPTQ